MLAGPSWRPTFLEWALFFFGFLFFVSFFKWHISQLESTVVALAAELMKHMPDHYSITQDRAVRSFCSWTVMSWQSEAEKCSSPHPAHGNWQLWSEHRGRSETQELPAKAEISNGLSIFLHQVVSVKINLLNFLFLQSCFGTVGYYSPTAQPQPR